MQRLFRTAALLALVALAALTPARAQSTRSDASPEGPAQIAWTPPAGKGRVVIVVSGHSGPSHYEERAARISALGYYAVLLDGKDVFSADGQGAGRLRQAIVRAQAAPAALPGKVAVVGFSQGGGAALAYASRMADAVAGVVVYYPQTDFILKHSDVKTFMSKVKVPVLMMAGDADTYVDCCLIATARSMDAAAKEQQAPFELVEFAHAMHDFDHAEYATARRLPSGVAYDATADADAWQRTVAALGRYLGN